MTPRKGFRSAAARRLSDSIEDNVEYPADSPDDIGDDFYDDGASQTESAIKSKTVDVSQDDVNGVKGWYRLLAGQQQQKKQEEEE